MTLPWDLAISEFGDLIFSGHGDLLGRSGQDLIEQRIRLRLMIQRGGWVYDTEKRLGSNLFRLINTPSGAIKQSAVQIVREALRGLDEITVEDVNVSIDDSGSLVLVIYYRVQETRQGVVTSSVERTLAIALPDSVTSSQGGGE